MKNILDKINRADEIQANLELDKTELGKHEVELSLIDELNKKANDAKLLYDNQYKVGLEIKKAQEMLFNALNSKNEGLQKYILIIKEIQSLMTKQEAIYKELGLSIRDDKSYINAWKVVDNFSAKDAESYISTVKDLLSQKKYIQ